MATLLFLIVQFWLVSCRVQFQILLQTCSEATGCNYLNHLFLFSWRSTSMKVSTHSKAVEISFLFRPRWDILEELSAWSAVVCFNPLRNPQIGPFCTFLNLAITANRPAPNNPSFCSYRFFYMPSFIHLENWMFIKPNFGKRRATLPPSSLLASCTQLRSTPNFCQHFFMLGE